jgi:hypothetical protein
MTQKINPKQRMGYGVFYSFRGVELEVRPKITHFFFGRRSLANCKIKLGFKVSKLCAFVVPFNDKT